MRATPTLSLRRKLQPAQQEPNVGTTPQSCTNTSANLFDTTLDVPLVTGSGTIAMFVIRLAPFYDFFAVVGTLIDPVTIRFNNAVGFQGLGVFIPAGSSWRTASNGGISAAPVYIS